MFEATCPKCGTRFPFDKESFEVECPSCKHLLYSQNDEDDEDDGPVPTECVEEMADQMFRERLVHEAVAEESLSHRIRDETRERLAVLERRRRFAIILLVVIAFLFLMRA